MHLPDLSVRRPVAVSVVFVTVAVFGFLATRSLPVELLPDLSYPTLTVQTVYPDAAPISVEQFVTRPVEEVVGVIPGVRDRRSVSRAGLSEVTLQFDWDESMEIAAMNVREKLGQVQLPDEAGRPRVLRFDPALDPVVRVALSGERPLDELWQIADRFVKRRLESVRGVAAAKVRGGLRPEIRVDADEDRLAALGLTLDDLAGALRSENVNAPGGTLKDFGAVYLIRTLNEFDDLDEIRRTAVGPGGVRIEDVADVRRGHRDREVVTRNAGQEVVELAVHREGSANTITVAAAIHDEIDALRGELGDDLQLTVLTDQSLYIDEAIGQVWWGALLGGMIAVFVLYFFLRDLRATAIVALTIPVSILAAFLPMSRAGVTLNIMSLGGLALGVGMLVDNSIVVLEAIDRRRRQGLGRREAAAQGGGDVAGAVTAATMTTICVFLPIIFVQGVAGQLFFDLAVTVCSSLVSSLLVSLTLIPTLAGLAGRGSVAVDQDEEAAHRPPRWVVWAGAPVRWIGLALGKLLSAIFWVGGALAGGAWWLVSRLLDVVFWPATRAFEGVGKAYPGLVRGALRARFVVLPVALALFAMALWVVPMLGTDLVPDLSQGEFAFRLTLPEGTPLENTVEVVERIEAPLVDDPRFARVFSVSGVLPSAASGKREQGENLAQIDFILPGGADADAEREALSRVREILGRFASVDAELVFPSLLTLAPAVAVQLYSDDLDELDKAAGLAAGSLAGVEGLRDVGSTSEPGSPEIRVELDREKSARLGLQAEQVSRSMRRQIQGEVVGQFREGEQRIDIRLRAAEGFRNRASAVEALRLRLADGTTVPVASLARVSVDRGPASIHRIAGGRAAVVTADAAVTDLADALERVQAAISGTKLPPGVTFELAGQDRELERSMASLGLALGLAIFLVYVVMAVQFESLVHPFVILLSVPMGIVGVVVALLVAEISINVLALIGAVMLAGIVVNNAIVLVDAVNRRRGEGQALDEAIVAAGGERLRPILMTTTTTVLALTPMALGLGAGDELRAPLAVTVIGGLLGATVLTLIVVPCIYRVMNRATVPEAGEAAPGPLARAPGRADG